MKNSVTLIPPVSARDHIAGQDGAPVTLVEYGDYQCPYCGEAHPVVQRLQKELGKKLRFVFRNFPLTEAHPYAFLAAETAEAAALQGKFWEMHDFIYENQESLEPDVLPAWVKELGLDMKKVGVAIKQGSIAKRIEEDLESGIESGVNGTPTFFINGKIYDGDDDFESLYAALLREEAAVLKRNQ